MTIIRNLMQIAFPEVCIYCGHTTVGAILCLFCVKELFEDPNSDRMEACSGVILPEGVLFQDAMWKYDKDGALQDILMQIKYHGIGKLAFELGGLMGRRAVLNKHIIEFHNPILLPVPLHPIRLRKRGYNQALLLAEGMSEVTGWNIIGSNLVIRRKNTKTQTGFNAAKRHENMFQVFEVIEINSTQNCDIIIVDDVFTTGATTWELARTVRVAGANRVGVLTVAMA